VRWLVFGTYDARPASRVAVLIEGLRAAGDDVVELNEPLKLDTAGRVAMLRQPWRLPLLAGKLARCWTLLALLGPPVRRAGPPDACWSAYLGTSTSSWPRRCSAVRRRAGSPAFAAGLQRQQRPAAGQLPGQQRSRQGWRSIATRPAVSSLSGSFSSTTSSPARAAPRSTRPPGMPARVVGPDTSHRTRKRLACPPRARPQHPAGNAPGRSRSPSRPARSGYVEVRLAGFRSRR